MLLKQLRTVQFRNLQNQSLDFSSRNLVTGPNGSGKTSVLEAIYFLGTGKSFRASRPSLLAREGEKDFAVNATIVNDHDDLNLSLQRKESKLVAKVGHEPVKKLSEFVQYLPVQWIGPNHQHLLESGPEVRRKLMDWGLFHVKPSFIQLWRRYRHALQQRNQLLKTKAASKDQLLSWDQVLCDAGIQLDEIRKDYVASLNQFLAIDRYGIHEFRVEMHYRSGWKQDLTLTEALQVATDRDLQAGFTSVGPHRAELLITLNGHPVIEQASRGQLKLIGIALTAAQIEHHHQVKGRESILLVDDLHAELDRDFYTEILRQLDALPSQLVVTSLTDEDVPDFFSQISRFHVEHGVLKAIN